MGDLKVAALLNSLASTETAFLELLRDLQEAVLVRESLLREGVRQP